MAFFDTVKHPTSRPSCRLLDPILDYADHPDLSDPGQFIASGLRAAQAASIGHRRTILNDVASVLGCNADELGFLFMDPVVAANDSHPVMMPDFRASMRSDAQLAYR